MENLLKIKTALLVLGVLVVLLFVFSFRSFFKKSQKTTSYGITDSAYLFCGTNTFEDTGRGAVIFKENCQRCHYTSEKKLTGPGMHKVLDRFITELSLRSYVGNSDSVIATDDLYAKELHEEYNNQPFNHNFRFSEDDWESLLLYLNIL